MIDCPTDLNNILLFGSRMPSVSASVVKDLANIISFLSRYISIVLRTNLPCCPIWFSSDLFILKFLYIRVITNSKQSVGFLIRNTGIVLSFPSLPTFILYLFSSSYLGHKCIGWNRKVFRYLCLVSCCSCKIVLRFYPWCAGTEVCYTLVLKKLKPKGGKRKFSLPTNCSREWSKNLNFGNTPSKQKTHRFIPANRSYENHFLKVSI